MAVNIQNNTISTVRPDEMVTRYYISIPEATIDYWNLYHVVKFQQASQCGAVGEVARAGIKYPNQGGDQTERTGSCICKFRHIYHVADPYIIFWITAAAPAGCGMRVSNLSGRLLYAVTKSTSDNMVLSTFCA